MNGNPYGSYVVWNDLYALMNSKYRIVSILNFESSKRVFTGSRSISFCIGSMQLFSATVAPDECATYVISV